MTNANFLPDAVQWSEGMLLSPQHFQQHDIYLQAVLHQRLLGLSPHSWGLSLLSLDAAQLPIGVISVQALEGVMPDGLPLVLNARDGRLPKPLDVSAQCVAGGKPVRIYLTVPPRTGALPVPSTSIRRYESLDGMPTIDEVTGMGDVVVERARIRVELFADGQRPPGHVALPLCEVVRDAQGEIVLTAYHPPLLRLAASAFLGGQSIATQFGALRDQLWEKLRELVGTAQDDAPEATSVMGAEARAHLSMARHLAACLPLFDAVLADPQCAPFQAWQIMAQVVGRMTAIGSNPRPLVMAPYDHADCVAGFQLAAEFVRRKLGLINTEWDNFAFARVGDGAFARRLPEDIGERVYIELRLREGAGKPEDWLQAAHFGTEELHPALRRQRQKGADWRLLAPRETAQLGLRADAVVCELRPQQIEIAGQGLQPCFRGGRALLVQGPAEGAPAAMVLHHRKRESVAPAPQREAVADHA